MAKRKIISVCCAPLKRTIDSFYRSPEQKANRLPGTRVEREEIVYVHGVIQQGNRRWHRGALVS